MVVWVSTVVACTSFCTAVVMAVALGRLLITMTGTTEPGPGAVVTCGDAAATVVGAGPAVVTAGVVVADAAAELESVPGLVWSVGLTCAARGAAPVPGVAAGEAEVDAELALGPGSAPFAAVTAFVRALPNCAVDPVCTSGEVTEPLVTPGALDTATTGVPAGVAPPACAPEGVNVATAGPAPVVAPAATVGGGSVAMDWTAVAIFPDTACPELSTWIS